MLAKDYLRTHNGVWLNGDGSRAADAIQQQLSGFHNRVQSGSRGEGYIYFADGIIRLAAFAGMGWLHPMRRKARSPLQKKLRDRESLVIRFVPNQVHPVRIKS